MTVDPRLPHYRIAALAMVLLASFLCLPHSASALTDATRDKLGAGGYVILMRHALTDGTGDPAGFILKDCTTQRNLNDDGRKQAAAQGQDFAFNDIKITRVLSSPWCRCIDTARLIAPGLGVEKRLELGSYLNVAEKDREAPTAEIRAEIEDWKGPGNLLIVTHQINIGDLVNQTIAQGAYVVLDPKGRKVVAIER